MDCRSLPHRPAAAASFVTCKRAPLESHENPRHAAAHATVERKARYRQARYTAAGRAVERGQSVGSVRFQLVVSIVAVNSDSRDARDNAAG